MDESGKKTATQLLCQRLSFMPDIQPFIKKEFKMQSTPLTIFQQANEEN